jgi:hypothetical protein
MICLISAFRTRKEAVTFERNNATVLHRPGVYWSVAIGEQGESPFREKAGRCVVMKPDRSYAEGWNNAICNASTQKWWRSDLRVSFLGTGDKILTLEALKPNLGSNLILLGQTLRPGSVPNRKRPYRLLAFASLRAWTPAALFPASFFSEFRFPTHTKIASDVDIFFAAFQAGLTFRSFHGYSIEMDVGGMSANIDLGAKEYRELYEARFGMSFLARTAEHIKRRRHYVTTRGAKINK